MKPFLASLLWYTHALASVEGWHSGAQGDARTVGRGGAGIALSDTIWGVGENPAGSALTVNGTVLQLAANAIEDTQGEGLLRSPNSFSAGLLMPVTPWGYALTLTESDERAFVREFAFSSSRLFLDDRLSLGAALSYGRSYSINYKDVTSASWGSALGVLYRFQKRIIIGMTLHTPMGYSTELGESFNHPWSVGLGIGQIPNRFFRAEMGLRLIGPSLPSESSLRLVPHIGLEYVFIDLKQLRFTLYTGTLLEHGRIHGTGGIGANIWAFTLGGAADLAKGYSNTLFSFGLDIGLVLKKLRILPRTVSAPAGGILPNPIEINEDWLTPRLQDDPENSFHEIGASIQRISKRLGDPAVILNDQLKILEEEADSFSTDLNAIGEDVE